MERFEDKNDCVVRALMHATGFSYGEAFEICRSHGRKTGCGMVRGIWEPMFHKHVDLVERFDLVRKCRTPISFTRYGAHGTFLVLFRGHIAAYRDGEWLDWIDSTRRHRIITVWQVK